MLCEKCKKNEAVVYYKESINGREKSMALCEKCASDAEKNGEISKFTLSSHMFEDPFSNIDTLFGSLFGMPQYNQRAIGESKKCSLCGAVFQDLISEGKAGCPECYRTFSEELSDTIGRIHGKTSHSGNAPVKFRHDREKKKKISTLEHELKKAISDERYEEAARLRDELKELRENKEDETK